MIEGHGDDKYRYGNIVSNFSSNIPSGLNLDGLKRHLSECLHLVEDYPEPAPHKLEAEIAARLGVASGEVMVTNGATEAIYLTAQAFRGVHSAVLQPTFCEYADACRMHGHKVTSFYSADEALPDGVQMVWLCNPNNPTGCVVDVENLIERYPDVCFVVDQSYEEFTTKRTMTASEATARGNVILLHSMTKSHCIPGLRLGYVTADERLLSRIAVCRMPWSVNALAVEAGHFLLKNPTKLDTTLYLEEAARLKSSLEATGAVEVWPTETHFMLCSLRMGRASALKSWLAEEWGILIRDASNFEGLNDSFFRVAAQSRRENERFVEAVCEFISL